LIRFFIVALFPLKEYLVQTLGGIDYWLFIDHFVVPYAANKLIAIDYGVSMERAYEIMIDSADYGELRHPISGDDDDDNDDDVKREAVAQRLKVPFSQALKKSRLDRYEERWMATFATQQVDQTSLVLL
jgi:hypothetical protein